MRVKSTKKIASKTKIKRHNGPRNRCLPSFRTLRIRLFCDKAATDSSAARRQKDESHVSERHRTAAQPGQEDAGAQLVTSCVAS